MLLSNGKEISRIVAASGSLAYTGRGWFWEWPLRWFDVIDVKKITIITKTITPRARLGNFRSIKPWQTFRFLENGTVNSFGLSNKGIDWWVNKCYPIIEKNDYKIIISIAPNPEDDFDTAIREVARTAKLIDKCSNLIAVELNSSCPNVCCNEFQTNKIWHFCCCIKENTNLPIIVKVGYDVSDYILKFLESSGFVAAIDAINTIPWSVVYGSRTSPLSKFGGGGVSGIPIFETALETVADSISLGTVFLQHPFMAGKIIRYLWK